MPGRGAGACAQYPKPDSGYVTDLADLLTPQQEKRIQHSLGDAERRTGVEVAVVTISSVHDYARTDNASIETFAKGLFDAFGVGNLPDNKGVLLLIAARDRQVRIELGAGHGNMRDAGARRIIDGTIVPRFKAGRYGDGITEGVEAILLTIADVRIGLNWPLIFVLIAIPVVGAVAISLSWSGMHGWGWACVGLLIALLQWLYRMVTTTAQSSWGWLTDGHDGGFGDGGFSDGGFGGGSSDGGGATGSW